MRVLLVSMPYMTPNLSSIALATLRPVLEQAGIATDTLYGSMLYPRTQLDHIFLERHGQFLFAPHLGADQEQVITGIMTRERDDLVRNCYPRERLDECDVLAKRLRSKLEQYSAYRDQLRASSGEVVQGEVDQLLGLLRTSAQPLPKGLSGATLQGVTELLRAAGHGLSASEVADAVGASRVTARRYLEHLADNGLADRQSRYGGSGRPEVEYRWRSARPGGAG